MAYCVRTAHSLSWGYASLNLCEKAFIDQGMPPRNIATVYCNYCHGSTHFIEVNGGVQDIQPLNAEPVRTPYRIIWRLLQCQRCGLDWAFYLDYMGRQDFFPPREVEFGMPFEHLPETLHQIYRETYTCLLHQSPRSPLSQSLRSKVLS